MKLTRFLLFICALSVLSCARKGTTPPDKNWYLGRLRECRAPLQETFLTVLDKDPPGELYLKLEKNQREALAVHLFEALYEQFLMGGSDGNFAAFLGDFQGRACFDETGCTEFAGCMSPKVAAGLLAGLKDVELPAAGANVPAAEPPPDPHTQTAPGKYHDPRREPPPLSELSISKKTFDISKPSPDTDLAPEKDTPNQRMWLANHQYLRLVVSANRTLQELAKIDVSPFGAPDDKEVPDMLVTRHGTALVRTSRALLLLDRNFETHVAWKTRSSELRTGAFTLWNDRILLAAEGCLIVLDATFRETGRVSLGLGPYKNGHDILMHGNEALILDNRARPIYLFRVDLATPEKPVILQSIQDYVVNGHLLYHWTDPKAGFWGVIRSSSGRGNSSQQVLVMSLKKPAAPEEPTAPEKPPGPEEPKVLKRSPHVMSRHWPGNRDPAILHELPIYQKLYRGFDPSPPKPPARGPVGPLMRTTGTRFVAGTTQPPFRVVASDHRGVHLGQFRLTPKKTTFEKQHTVVSFEPVQRPAGKHRTRPGEVLEHEDPFEMAESSAAIDQRGSTLVVVLADRAFFFDVSSGRPQVTATVENPLGLPERVRLHP